MIVIANWRLDNAKSPAAMLQAKTARTPHTNRSDGTYTRSHAVRTYIPQVGYLFSSLDMLYVCTCIYEERESTARHSSKNNENETEDFGKKNEFPVPSPVIMFCLVGTPYTRSKTRNKKNRTEELLSQPRTPPTLSGPPRHRFDPAKAFLTLCHD